MLPILYTLGVPPVVGHLRNTAPSSINCPVCGHEIQQYESFTVVLDSEPKCGLVSAAGGTYLVSLELKMRLQAAGLTGYKVSENPVALEKSAEFSISLPKSQSKSGDIGPYYHFVISGRADGPWQEHVRGDQCSRCGEFMAELQDFQQYLEHVRKSTSRRPRLVYPSSWYGEDFFELTEPGSPIITQRAATILESIGDLEVETIDDRTRNILKRTMPNYALELASRSWQRPVCLELSHAEWVMETQTHSQ